MRECVVSVREEEEVSSFRRDDVWFLWLCAKISKDQVYFCLKMVVTC